MGKTKEKVKQILLRRYSVSGLEQYIPATNIKEIDETQKFKNFEDAIHIGATKEIEYNNINPVSRFFSHFLPNSWTKAGRLRNEIKECDEAFKEVGYTEKDLTNYYIESMGPELYEANIVAKANKHFFSSTAEKEIKEYALENKIAEPIDLTADVIDDINALSEEDPEPVYKEPEEETKEIEEPDSGIIEEGGPVA